MIGGLLKSTSSLAILAAAGLLIGGVALTPKAARAADLGGDCCADLEERVANLEATTVTKGNRKVSLEISGRLAYTMAYFVDNSSPPAKAGNGAAPVTTDSKSDFYPGSDDSGNGPALFFDGSGKVNSDVSIGFHQEIDYDLTGTEAQNTRNGGQATGFGQSFVYVSSKTLGKLQIGHTHGVFDDFGGMGFGGAYDGGLQGSLRAMGYFLRDSTGGSSGLTYGAALVNSGLDDSSDNGIKYTSPAFGKWLTFEAALTGDDTVTVGAALSGNVTKSISVKAGVAYMTANDGDALTGGNAATANQNGTARRWAASGGINDADSGLFLEGDYAIALADGNAGATSVTAAVNGFVDPTGAPIAGTPASLANVTHLQDITVWEVLGGWHKNVTGMGNTEIWGSYVHANNGLGDNTSGRTYQIGVDQAIDSASAHLFVLYENSAVSLPAGYQDLAGAITDQNLSTVTAGMSVTF